MTPFGRYYYNVAPYGNNSIPELYNRRMHEALDDLDGHVRVVDDSLIFGKDAESHVRRVRDFLQRCRDQNIQLNPSKFVFAQTEIKFAGLILNNQEYRLQDKVIESIQKMPLPEMITDMRALFRNGKSTRRV